MNTSILVYLLFIVLKHHIERHLILIDQKEVCERKPEVWLEVELGHALLVPKPLGRVEEYTETCRCQNAKKDHHRHVEIDHLSVRAQEEQVDQEDQQ